MTHFQLTAKSFADECRWNKYARWAEHMITHNEGWYA